MIAVEKFEIKVLLEGIEVKTNSVQISERDGMPPTAVVTFPGSPTAIFLLPKTVCLIYVKIVDDFYLIFEGELTASAMNRMQDKRVVQHTFAGVLNNWITTVMADLSATMQSTALNITLMQPGATATKTTTKFTYDAGLPSELPLRIGLVVKDKFGERPTRTEPDKGTMQKHDGIDFGAPIGTTVYATANGYAFNYTDKGTTRSYGTYIELKHTKLDKSGTEYSSKYAHLSESGVKDGEWVTAGTPIGKTGQSGIGTGPHLHYGVYKGSWPQDPAKYLWFNTEINKPNSNPSVDAATLVYRVDEAFNKYTSAIINYNNNFPIASTEVATAKPYYTVAAAAQLEYGEALEALSSEKNATYKDDTKYWDQVADHLKTFDVLLKMADGIVNKGAPGTGNFDDLSSKLTAFASKESLQSLVSINNWSPLQFFAMLLGNKREHLSIPESLRKMLDNTALRIGGYYRMIDKAFKIIDKVDIIDNTEAKSIIENSSVNEYLSQSMSAMSSGATSTTIYNALMNLISKFSYKITELTAPVWIADRTPSAEPVMHKLFIRPHSDYIVPCTSNIICNDDVLNMSFAHSWDSEPTRTVTTVLPSNLNPSDVMNIAFSVVMPQGDNLADLFRPSYGGISLTAEEWLRGLNVQTTKDTTSMAKSYLGAFLHEQYNVDIGDVDKALATVLAKEEDVQGDYTTWLKNNTSKYKEYAAAIAQIDYVRQRQAGRNISISALYNPYRICGMPCMIIDDIFPGMVGTLSAINTIFSADGTVTQTLGVSSVRIISDNLTGLNISNDSKKIRPVVKNSQFVEPVHLGDAHEMLELWFAEEFKPENIYKNYYSHFGIDASNNVYLSKGVESMYYALKKVYTDKGYSAIRSITYRALCNQAFIEGFRDKNTNKFIQGYYNLKPDDSKEPSDRKVPYRADRALRVATNMHTEDSHITTESL